MMNDLTDAEKRDMINHAITTHYPKMLKDERQITSYNYHIYSDLLSFCMEQFLTKKPLEYQFQICVTDDKILNYMGRSMSLNLRSNSSPYWNHIRKQSYNYRGVYLAETDKAYLKGEFDEIDRFDNPDEYECMMAALDKLDFYYKPLVTDYYIKGISFVKMNKKYGISLANLKKAVTEGIAIMRQHCKDFL
jgi:hypothetical protein